MQWPFGLTPKHSDLVSMNYSLGLGLSMVTLNDTESLHTAQCEDNSINLAWALSSNHWEHPRAARGSEVESILQDPEISGAQNLAKGPS